MRTTHLCPEMLRTGLKKISEGNIDWGFDLGPLDKSAAGTLLDDLDVAVGEEGLDHDLPEDDHPGNWNEPVDAALQKGFKEGVSPV